MSKPRSRAPSSPPAPPPARPPVAPPAPQEEKAPDSTSTLHYVAPEVLAQESPAAAELYRRLLCQAKTDDPLRNTVAQLLPAVASKLLQATEKPAPHALVPGAFAPDAETLGYHVRHALHALRIATKVAACAAADTPPHDGRHTDAATLATALRSALGTLDTATTNAARCSLLD